MTRRERIIAALEHRPADFIPYQIDFTIEEQRRVAEYLGDPDFVDKIGNHMRNIYWDFNCHELPDRPGIFLDDYGVEWDRTGPDKDIGIIWKHLLPEPTLEGFTFPELDKADIHRRVEALMQEDTDQFRYVTIGFALFERAWTLRGMTELLMDMLAEPEFVDELLDRITDINLEIIDIALAHNVDAFMFGDDWGQQHGLIMGPKLWRRFLKPRLARMYGRVKQAGKFVLQHSCGDISEVYPDLVEIGLDAHNTFQPEIFDIVSCKAGVGQKLTFWGGISTQALLPFVSVEELYQEVPRIMNILGRNGGYICSPTHSTPRDVPPENMVALIDICQHQDRYLDPTLFVK